MQRSTYDHVQRGWVVLPLLGGIVLLVLLAPGGRLPWFAWLPIGLALVVAAVFSRLRITVDDDTLSWRFGWGWPGWKVQLANVAGVAPDRSTALEGWGIRLTSRGTLYNVSGLDAVEVTLRSGKRFRLGTDEPEVLVRELQARLPSA